MFSLLGDSIGFSVVITTSFSFGTSSIICFNSYYNFFAVTNINMSSPSNFTPKSNYPNYTGKHFIAIPPI